MKYVDNIIKAYEYMGKLKSDKKQRLFKSGANRNSEEGKLDPEGFYSPRVEESYMNYMNKHRQLEDGTLRDSDNWQKHFGEEHFSVCMKSGYRHFFDWWKEHRGLKSRDGLEDALNGLKFNVNAYLDKFLKDKALTDTWLAVEPKHFWKKKSEYLYDLLLPHNKKE